MEDNGHKEETGEKIYTKLCINMQGVYGEYTRKMYKSMQNEWKTDEKLVENFTENSIKTIDK